MLEIIVQLMVIIGIILFIKEIFTKEKPSQKTSHSTSFDYNLRRFEQMKNQGTYHNTLSTDDKFKQISEFIETYDEAITAAFKDTEYYEAAERETYPFLAFMAFPLISQKHDISFQEYFKKLSFKDMLVDMEIEEFHERIDLYNIIMLGKDTVGYCMMCDFDQDNPFLKVFITYADLIYYPPCAYNYFESPLLVKGIDENIKYMDILFEKAFPLIRQYIDNLTNERYTNRPAKTDIPQKTLNRDEVNSAVADEELNYQHYNKDDYGYVETRPVFTSSIAKSDIYLSRLTTLEGDHLDWLRLGSIFVPNCGGKTNSMVDNYQLYLHGEPFKKIYICPYGDNTEHTPAGFILANEYDTHDGDIDKKAHEFAMTVEQYLDYNRQKYIVNEKRLKKEKEKFELLKQEEKYITQIYPNFVLEEELKNPLFIKLTNNNVDAKTAFEYVHKETYLQPIKTHDSRFDCIFDENYYYAALVESDIELNSQCDSLCASLEFNDDEQPESLKDEIGESDQIRKEIEEYRHQRKMEKFRKWATQATHVKAKYPIFDIRNEFFKPNFANLTDDIGMIGAYEVLNLDILFERIHK